MIQFRVGDTAYSLSPTTLRYANNALSCLAIFDEALFASPIYEIGAGYGGEYRVFHEMTSSLGRKMASWSIFDLQTSTGLIKRFLETQGTEFPLFQNIYSGDSNPPASPIVLSNGAISEMRGQLLSDYLEVLVRPAVGGYFITNFESHSLPYGGISTSDFTSILKSMGKKTFLYFQVNGILLISII